MNIQLHHAPAERNFYLESRLPPDYFCIYKNSFHPPQCFQLVKGYKTNAIWASISKYENENIHSIGKGKIRFTYAISSTIDDNNH